MNTTPIKIILTGGPGAGKTAVLETVKKISCEHFCVIPETASLLFNGGFPRGTDLEEKKCAQRAIFHVQKEHERFIQLNKSLKTVLLDRGSLDGLAYWPNSDQSFFDELQTTHEAELARYDHVIHLRTPKSGYNHSNPFRIETNEEALKIDLKIEKIWNQHPHYYSINSTSEFLEKAIEALKLIRTLNASHSKNCCP